MKHVLIGIVWLAAAGVCWGQVERPGAPVGLRCEYLTNPVGLDEVRPRFSWVVNDPRTGAVQSAYQILVAGRRSRLEPGRADVWDSGKVASDASIHVVYGGPELESRRRYWWAVRTWDGAGETSAFSEPAFWETGLLEPGDWRAKWVGAPVELARSVEPHVGYHSEIAHHANTVKWVTIDLGAERQVDGVRLVPCEPFSYSRSPGFLFPVRFRVEVATDGEFADAVSVVDQGKEDFANPGAQAQVWRFEAVRGRYVRLWVDRLAHRDADNHAFALAEMQVLADGDVVSQGCMTAALDTIEQDDWGLEHLNDGVLGTRKREESPAGPAQMLRREFDLPGQVRRARVYATALGIYELYINGRRVGDQVLAPEWTDYRQRIQYQTYDVTGLLKAGRNVVAAVVAEGWYAGLVGIGGRTLYGRRLGLWMQLEVRCADGQRRVIVTDESWRATTEGPIVAADIIRGQQYDARKEQPGWDRAGFNDEHWSPVKVVEGITGRLVGQHNEPIRLTQQLRPVAVSDPQPGVYVFDMGQNMVGWCRLRVRGQAGKAIELRHGERVNADGTLYTENLRGDFQRDVYVCADDGMVTIEPRLTYHGFQYVEVTGAAEKPDPEDLVGCVVHSAPPVTGRFECSEPMLNKLMANILWTQRGNMHSTPTDCPQRDERLGWMGDAQIFSQAACFNMDMAAFFTKWLADVRDAQTDDGRFSDFSPNVLRDQGKFLGAPAWADAGVIVPWCVYVNYGDRRVLERHFESARRWVEYVRSQSPAGIWERGRGNDYGDWLNGDWLRVEGYPTRGADTPRPVIATMFAAHSAELVARMAAVLGRHADAEQCEGLARQIKEAFCERFVGADGQIEADTQSAYALALRFDILPPETQDKAAEHLDRLLDVYGGRPSTGIQATNRMMLELVRRGREQTAFGLLMRRSVPSWGYMVDQGATTVWERWDGWVQGRGVADAGMNSFNHYAFGAVGEWIWRHVVGIAPDPERPGYKHFSIRPRVGGGLTWARGEYDSIHGKIVSSWRFVGGRFELEARVPANTTATVYVPAVGDGTVRVDDMEGVRPLGIEDGCAAFAVGGGMYRFVCEKGQPSGDTSP